MMHGTCNPHLLKNCLVGAQRRSRRQQEGLFAKGNAREQRREQGWGDSPEPEELAALAEA